MKLITDEMISKAYAAMENRVLIRAYDKYKNYARSSGAPLNGLDYVFNDNDAEILALNAYNDELAGYPMPEFSDGLGGGLSKVFKKIKRAVKKIGRKLRPIIKRVAAPVLAAVVTMYLGPVAGKMVATAVGNMTGKIVQKKLLKREQEKLVRKAQAEYNAWNAANPGKSPDLPIGINQKQAHEIITGKVPAGMTEEKVWHAVQQAKMIVDKNITPHAAYVAHYHSLKQDAPPYKHRVDPDQKLVDELDLAEQNEEILLGEFYKAENSLRQRYISKAAPKKRTPSSFRWGASRKSVITNLIDCKKKTLSGRPLSDIMFKVHCPKEVVAAAKAALDKQRKLISDLKIKIEESRIQSFKGAPYGVKPPMDQIALPDSPISQHIAKTTTKPEAVKKVLSPELTKKVETAAREVLKTKGVDIQSTEGKNALKLQIKQLQQQVASALAQNKQVITVPAAPIEPVLVKNNQDGTETVLIPKENKGSGMALLIPAAALLFALSG